MQRMPRRPGVSLAEISVNTNTQRAFTYPHQVITPGPPVGWPPKFHKLTYFEYF